MESRFNFRAWNGSRMLFCRKNEYGFVVHGGEVWEIVDDIEYKKDYPLMQCTGLKDKNGKDIYEGDIITGVLPKEQYRLGTMGEVKYSNNLSSFVSRNEAGDTLIFKISGIEIIGNIYENGDLLNDN